MNQTTIRPTGEGSDFPALGADLIRDIENYLATQHPQPLAAHRLVTATTDQLVRDALAALPPAPAGDPAGMSLPGGLWRVLPDRLLSLHPARRGEAVARLRITPAQHLDLTALVLERWGWAQTGERLRTCGGRRCILGAQRTVFLLGYGTEDTATAAGDHINNVLRARGIVQPYPRWNEHPHVSGEQALAVVRAAALVARGGTRGADT
ncbi:DUF6197 family protein [Actinacidiphila acidipaludis]|uniref:Uncharacterized protein n=1 Tax=Actinacidiphila acidipaludis TaxID=2873382 RepID=A0ABS7Q644_9ACTN|nr:hypothetical protein [Streptomyces acidipaludis]MBY8877472.1 hypothetical protein [Streptomyces acidipaludis]